MRRKPSVAVAVWLLAAVALAGLAWYWWREAKAAKPAVVQVHPTPGSNRVNLPPGGLDTNAAPLKPVLTSSNIAADKNVHAPPDLTNPPSAANSPTNYPRVVQNVFEMQVALAREGLSPGSIDGLIGPQTRAALRSFQQKEHLTVTGELDDATRGRLLLTELPTTVYEITSDDSARLQPLSPTWLGKSRQTALEYETLLELVSEKAQAHPDLVRRLNPDLDWDKVAPGERVQVPSVTYPPADTHAAYLTIRLEDRILEAWDQNTNLLAHFPCSIARRVEKRPVGALHVVVIAAHPNYTFDPAIFPESAEARELKAKLVLPPGPNNPVGVAWIGLDRPGYGIHGTPRPELVGRTESHGCFRLANWNAEYLLRLVAIGTPVYVQP